MGTEPRNNPELTPDAPNAETREWVRQKCESLRGLAKEVFERDIFCDDKSVQWLASLIEFSRPKPDKKGTKRALRDAIGCFLGEALIARYGGEWFMTKKEGLAVQLPSGNIAFPFSKVRKQFENGLADSIWEIYRNAKAIATNAPILKVDDKHQMMNYPAGTTPEVYRVRATSDMILDATGYTFNIPPDIRDEPLNSIQVVQSKTNQFELTWQPGTTRYELSKETLRPRPGSMPFEGFKAGDKLLLSIGVFYEAKKYAPVWITIVEVQ